MLRGGGKEERTISQVEKYSGQWWRPDCDRQVPTPIGEDKWISRRRRDK